MIARAVSSRHDTSRQTCSRDAFGRRRSTHPRLSPLGASLALIVLSLLSGAAAEAQEAKKWSLGLTFMNLSADNRLESTGAAVRSTPGTVAFASAEVDDAALLGVGVGFRPSRLFGVKLSLTHLGELPTSFRAVCAPCELLDTDPGTGEEYVWSISTYEQTAEADLDVDVYLLDLSIFPPLSRYSSSSRTKLEIFLGPTFVDLSSSLNSFGADLDGVSAEIEVENSLGAHLGLAFHPGSVWTIHATARWIPTELTIEHEARQSPGLAGQGILGEHAPLGAAESDWIMVGLGFDWRF